MEESRLDNSSVKSAKKEVASNESTRSKCENSMQFKFNLKLSKLFASGEIPSFI